MLARAAGPPFAKADRLPSWWQMTDLHEKDVAPDGLKDCSRFIPLAEQAPLVARRPLRVGAGPRPGRTSRFSRHGLTLARFYGPLWAMARPGTIPITGLRLGPSKPIGPPALPTPFSNVVFPPIATLPPASSTTINFNFVYQFMPLNSITIEELTPSPALRSRSTSRSRLLIRLRRNPVQPPRSFSSPA